MTSPNFSELLRGAGGGRQGASESDFEAAEVRLGTRISPEFRAVFSKVDGQDQMGDDLFCFWPVAKWSLASTEASPWWTARLVVFCDFMVDAYHYALDPSSKGAVVLLAGGTPAEVVPVAATFDEFIARYVADSRAVEYELVAPGFTGPRDRRRRR